MTMADHNGEIVERHVRPFAEWMLDQREGFLAYELSEKLNALVEAVDTSGKAGSLTLTIKVKPTSKGSQGSVMVSDTVVAKLPEPDRHEALFFVDRNANLTRSNPAQPQLPLREVPRSEAPADNKETAASE
jgi:hypothetical protein